MTPVVGRLLERRALLDGERTAAVCGDARLTFRELDELTGRMAAFLAERGVARGGTVAALLRNGIAFCCLYHAAARLGAVLCPLNWRLTARELAPMLRNCGAPLLLFDEDLAETASPLSGLPGLRHCIPVWADGGIARLLDACPPLRDDCPAAPGDPLLIVHTSGTSGRPKGAVLSQGQMLWSSITIAATVDARGGDAGLIGAPMFHVGGLSFATLFAHLGAAAVLAPKWEPDGILALIERERINHFFAVATMLAGLTQSRRFAETDLGSLRWIMSGGGALPAPLIHAFAGRGIPLVQSYGTTETAGPATVVPAAGAVARAGTSGLPFFHTDLRVVDRSGRRAEAGCSGEILVRAPHVSSGYWNDRQATAESFRDGWFHTGDSGFLDADGYLHVEGRIGEMIVSGGENVFPAEVERVLQSHPGVSEVAVIGVPDPRWGEIVCAVVHPRSEAAPTLDDLASHCSSRLAGYKRPRRLVLSPDPLPRNAMGKLLRTEIRDGAAQ